MREGETHLEIRGIGEKIGGREGSEEEGGKVDERKQEALLCTSWTVFQEVLDWGAAFVTPHESHLRPASESYF